MCGIIGTVNLSETIDPKNLDWVKSNIQLLTHRGPDQNKIWTSNSNKIVFGHTKLSIIDLSEENTQPMLDKENDIIITYNGEIYNYLELKKDLKKKFIFETDSDTEVIIKAYLEWGEDFLEKIEGMFSLCLFDQKRNLIFLAKDRIGEKPLFYSYNGSNLFFSSELRSFNSFSQIDINSLNETLLNGFTLEKNKTILSGINELEPAEYIKIDVLKKDFVKNKYWYPSFNIKVNNSYEVKENEFDKILNSNIEKCLRSDVETCVTLSGGLDSSIITALASKQKKINTFSVIFKNKKYDESEHIVKISKFFKTNHSEIEAEDYSLEKILDIFGKLDIPILDSSVIPSYILFNNIRKKGFKVAVGGDGADEIFGGYNHYRFLNKIVNFKKYINLNTSALDRLFENLEIYNFKGAQYLRFLFNTKYIYKIPFFFNNKFRRKVLKEEFFKKTDLLKFSKSNINIVLKSRDIDLNYTLPKSLLNKLDRCSMLNSIESRSPFLTKEIVEFGMSQLNYSDLISSKSQKIFLKKIAKKYLPKDFVYNRKQGFSFPLMNIINNPNEMKKIQEILTSKQSLFNKNFINKLLKLAKDIKIRPELVFCLLNIQIWKNNNNINI